MSNQISGILHFYPDEKIPSTCSTFTLQGGENIIGSSLLCDITLPYPNISAEHCKVTLNEEEDYSIEDIGSTHGVFRVTEKQSRQQLKPGKEYELSSGKEFYLANLYKCVFKAIISEGKPANAKNTTQKSNVKVITGGVVDLQTLQLLDGDDLSYCSEGTAHVAVKPQSNQKVTKFLKDRQPKPEGNQYRIMVNNQQIPERNSSKGNSNAHNIPMMSQESVKNLMNRNQERNSQTSTQIIQRENLKQFAARSVNKSRKDDTDEDTDEESEEFEFEIEDDNHEESQARKDQEQKEQVEENEEDDEGDSEYDPKEIVDSTRLSGKKASKGKASQEEERKATRSSQSQSPTKAKNIKNKEVEIKDVEKLETPKKRGRPPLNKSGESSKADKSLNTKRLGGEDDLLEFEAVSTRSKRIKPDNKRLVRSPFKFIIPVKTQGNSSVTRGSPTSSEAEESSPQLSPIQKKKGNIDNRIKEKIVIEEDEESSDEDTLLSRNAFQVMFSGLEKRGFGFADDKHRLANLGAKIVEDKEKNFTILVMNSFKRTVKLLLAISNGIDVVSYDWVKDSIKKGRIQPPQDYIYTDKAAESQFKFKLSQSIEKARNRKKGLLEGYRIYLPPTIIPSHSEMSRLVESMGGLMVKTKPSSFQEGTLVIVDNNDVKNANHFRGLGFEPYTSELVFSAILQQKLNLNENKV